MPKQKRHSATKKRFQVTGTGKLRRRRAMKSHLLEKKSAKRKRGIRQNRRAGPLGAREGLTDPDHSELFREQAEHFARLGSPVYARLARRCAEEPFIEELVVDWSWDVPLRLFGGVHYLVLAGIEP